MSTEKATSGGPPDNSHFSPSPPENVDFVGFWRRAAALVIDCTVIKCAAFVVVPMFSVFVLDIFGEDKDPERSFREFVAAATLGPVVLLWLYEVILTCSPLQGTLGKKAVGAKIIDRYGKRLSFWRSNFRFFSKYGCAVSAFLLVYSFPFATHVLDADVLGDMDPSLFWIAAVLLVAAGINVLLAGDNVRNNRAGHDFLTGTFVVKANKECDVEEPLSAAPGAKPQCF